MLIDQGCNDQWPRTVAPQPLADGSCRVTFREPLGQAWRDELITVDLPEALHGQPVRVTRDGKPVASQIAGDEIAIAVTTLAPDEQATFVLTRGSDTDDSTGGVTLTESGDMLELSNGCIALRLARRLPPNASIIPAAVLAVRRGDGPWLGDGRIESPLQCESIHACVVAAGPLYTKILVTHGFAGGKVVATFVTLRPGEPVAEIAEASSLPSRLWPAPRPYREIGSLGKSFWDRPVDDIGVPCVRPCPTSNVVFDLRAGWQPDRMQTHSTAAWEIMDLPLGAAELKAYTAMRAAYPGIDAGWMGFYDSTGDTWLGVTSIDLAHWGLPDDLVHPVHRTPGTNAEVACLDSDSQGTCLRFPLESLRRRWLLVLTERPSHEAADPGKPLRLPADLDSPAWAWRRRRGDLRLDKVKEWLVDWDDAGHAHPRVLCSRADFPRIRQTIARTPALQALWESTRALRPADRYIVEGEPAALAEVERITNGGALVQDILNRGFTGPVYAIGLARPIRRYALACDVLWDSFTVDEQRTARRVLARAAYILSDGDWWQYAFRPGETTYLPNFNTDVFACAGLVAMVLSDHPCSEVWVAAAAKRFDLELELHLRHDGTGEENLGSYYMSTWMQLYMPFLWALRHTGTHDYSGDPRVHAGGRFMLNVLVPPDPRDGGYRHIAPIGHHPNASKQFAVIDQLAAFIRHAEPRLAANLAWAWHACHTPVGNLYDHSGPAANALTRHYIFHDPDLVPEPPVLSSTILPHVGAVLRSHDLSASASFLLLKAGRVHSHHDQDEGSFHYYGRGVPLALDGLRLANGAPASEHNAVTFALPGQPSGRIDHFTTTPVADYVRAIIPPRGYCSDTMYLDNWHRSGFTREIVLVKAQQPGQPEYLVVKDTCTGPEATQWNLDVLSREPAVAGPGHLWFPGHPEFGMGLDLIVAEPSGAQPQVERGVVADFNDPERPAHWLRYPINEHWLVHLPAGPGATFVAVLFPRPADEAAPQVEYWEREETLIVTHATGREIVFLRPNPTVGLLVDGVRFRGRAGVVSQRAERHLAALDAAEMEPWNGPNVERL